MDGAATAAPPGRPTASRIRPFLLAGDPVTAGSPADVIFPFVPIFNDKSGQLDASLFVNVTKQVKIGAQGVNLTDTVTKTLQQYTVDGRLAPRSYFKNDRRYSFVVRGNW